MKRLLSMVLVLSVCLGLSHAARAEEGGDFAYRPPLVYAPSPELERARNLKYAGMWVTAFGIVTTGAGVAVGIAEMFLSAFTGLNDRCTGSRTGFDTECGPPLAPAIASVALVSVGVVALGAGIPMWTIGKKRERRIQKGVSISASSATLHF
jgi:hypothetical protein